MVDVKFLFRIVINVFLIYELTIIHVEQRPANVADELYLVIFGAVVELSPGVQLVSMLEEHNEILSPVVLFLVRAASYPHLVNIVIVNVVLVVLKYWLSYLVLLGVVKLVTVELFDVALVKIYLVNFEEPILLDHDEQVVSVGYVRFADSDALIRFCQLYTAQISAVKGVN